MRRAFRIAASSAIAASALFATGCLTPEQIVSLQRDVTDIRTQMEAVRKENKETADRVEAVQASIGKREEDSRAQAAEGKRQVDGIRDDMRSVNSHLEELQQRLSSISQSLAAGAPRPSQAVPAAPLPPPSRTGDPADPRPAAPERASASPDDLFNQAYADYSKGNYAPARLGFEEFLKRYPRTEKSDDGLYWIGLCYYDQGEYQDAIMTFDRLIQEFPSGDKVPGAHLKKGLALLGMNKTAQGVVQLKYLLEKFPKSDEARIAGDRLKELGVKP